MPVSVSTILVRVWLLFWSDLNTKCFGVFCYQLLTLLLLVRLSRSITSRTTAPWLNHQQDFHLPSSPLLSSQSSHPLPSFKIPHTHTHTHTTPLHNPSHQPTSLPLTRYQSPHPHFNPPCCSSRSPWHIQCSLQCLHASRFGALHTPRPPRSKPAPNGAPALSTSTLPPISQAICHKAFNTTSARSDARPRHHSAAAIAAPPPPPRDSAMSVSLLSVTPIVTGQ